VIQMSTELYFLRWMVCRLLFRPQQRLPLCSLDGTLSRWSWGTRGTWFKQAIAFSRPPSSATIVINPSGVTPIE